MKKKQIRTIFLWVGGSIVALTLCLQALLFFFGDEILKESILVAFRQYATQRFQEEYLPALDFEELQLNLLGGNITVTDLKYRNGLPKKDTFDSLHTFYRIHIPEATIEGLKLWDMYRNRKIQLDQIVLTSPRIAIAHEQPKNPTDTLASSPPPTTRELIAEQERKIYETLSEYVELLAFNKLQITNATFLLDLDEEQPQIQDSLTFRQSDWFAQQFTVILEDFRLDSTSRKQDQRILFTKNIQVKLGKYQLILPDSSYALQADTLTFSTEQRKLSFRALEVRPLKAKDSATWYSAQVPALEMTNIDLVQMMYNRVVNIDTLHIHHPQVTGYGRNLSVTVKGDASSPQLSQVHPDTLYAYIKKYWNRIAVNQFRITQGQLQLYEIQQDTLPWLEVPEYSVSFNDFQLDASVNQRSVDSLSNVLPMDSIDVYLRDMRLWFPDRQHYFATDQLTVKTDRLHRYACDIQFDSARVLPRVDSLALFLAETRPPRLGYDIRTSEVKVYGIALEALSFSKFAKMDSVRIRQPQVLVANFSETPFGSLPRIRDQNANDTSSNTIKEIFYNWSHARLNLYPVVAPGRAEAWFDQILVTTMHLDRGQVQIMKANNAFSDFIEIAHVERLQAYYQDLSIGDEAHPLIEISDTTALASRVAVYAEEVDMQLNDSWFQFPYNQTSAVSGGWLQAEEVKLSTLTSRGYVSQVKFWPNRSATHLSSSQMEQLDIPYFGIEGIDFGRLYNLQLANISRVALVSPIINLRVSPSTRERNGDFSMAELYEQTAPYLDRLSINHLQVQDAEIKIQPKVSKTPTSWFSTASLNVNIENFFLDSLTTITPERPFYAEDVRVDMDQFSFSLPVEDGEEDFQAERFLYSSYSDQLTVDQLHRVRDSLIALDALEELTVTQLALHQMNYYRYFTDQEIEVEKVIVRRPTVDIKSSPGTSGRAPRQAKNFQPILYPKIKSVARGIYVNQLLVEEGTLSYLQQGEDTLHHFVIDTLLLNASRLAIDSVSHQQEAKMFFADEIDFRIHMNNYLLKLPEARQSIRAREVILTNRDDRIFFNELEIRPFGLEGAKLADYPDKNLLSLATPSLQIVGLDVEKAYLKGEMDIQEVNIMNPRVTLYNFTSETSSGNSSQPSWSDLAPQYLDELSINQINFTNGAVAIYQHRDSEAPAFGAERLDLSVLGLQVDSASYTHFMAKPSPSGKPSNTNFTRRLLLADDLLIRVRDYQVALADTLYTAKADLISLSTKNPQLDITGFTLEPRVPRYLYKDVFQYQKTRVAAQIQHMRLNNINFEELIKQRHLQATQLSLEGIQIDAFKDSRAPRDDERILPMHQDMLLDLGLLVSLDTVRVSNGFINYAERAPEAGRDGIITFEHLNGMLTNATNHPDRIRDSVVFTLKLSTEVMGEGELKAAFQFPMADKHRRFTVSGSLEPMDLKAFNPILEPAAFVHIRKGYTNGMRFQVQGDQDRATGSMRFNYQDLGIMLVDKNKGRPGLDERVGSFIANAFVVKSDNPRAIFFRVGEIDYERDPSRSMFSYWWRSILSGIKSSIGMQRVAERTRDVTVLEEDKP
ncbi:MAG: DUF748 domain-containing protein [Cyclobacteriaceae bacterium]